MTTMMTREEAIAKLVDADVAKWGEGERAASQEMRRNLSHALALNAVAHLDLDNIDKALAKVAKAMMTPADKKALRNGAR